VTTEGLTPQDVDGLPDVYDARLNGGFPPVPAAREPCEGDACQGPLTNPAALLIPGSVSQAPGGNFAAAGKAAVSPKSKRKSKRKASSRVSKRKRRVSGRVKGRGARRRGVVVRRGGRG
jgi:hypothetical protein